MSAIPQGDGDQLEDQEEEQISYFKKRADIKRNKSKEPSYKSKEWIKQKKDRQVRQGREIREDSKYSGRKRKGRGVY